MSNTKRSERLRKRRQAMRRRSDAPPIRLFVEMMEDRTVPAQATAVGPDLWFIGPSPNASAQLGQSLYFLAHQASAAPGASDIWKVNGGTTAQPVNVPALVGHAVSEIVNVNGSLFVTAYALPANAPLLPPTTPADVNVWKLDGSAPGGATKLTDFHASGAGNLQVAGNRVFFQHTSFVGMLGNSMANELWSSDGTAGGTKVVANFTGDMNPDLNSAVAAGADLYFQVYSFQAPTPPSLWVTDGTSGGTHAVNIVGGGAAPAVAGFGLETVGVTVFFGSSNSAGTQSQLWSAVNGQATLLRTFTPATGNSFAPMIGAMTSSGSNLYFALNGDKGGAVWVSDGSANGTQPVYAPAGGSLAASIGDLVIFKNSVYFASSIGGSIFKTDGLGGATPVPLPASVSGVYPSLSVVDNQLYFLADDGIHGAELWSTDGTANGTGRRTDINPGSGSSFPIGPLQAGGNEYVVASDSIPNPPAMYAPTRLWKLADANAPVGATATTTLSTSSNSITTGGSVTLTANVTATASGLPAPSGSVVFRDAMQVYGSAPIVNGIAKLVAVISVPGAHSLQAVYLGNSTFDESISPSVNVTASQGATNVALTSSDASADPGQLVKFTATVTPALATGQAPGGFVSFFDGTSFLGTGFLTSGVATYQTGSLAAGSHSIKAVYSGDVAYSSGASPALTQTVGAALNVGLTTSSNSPALGQAIKLTAHLTAINGASLPIGSQVTFRDGASPIGTGTINNSGDAILNVSNLAVGAHNLTATYAGANTIASNTVSITVQKAVSTLSLISTAQTARVGQSVTLTASLSAPSAGMPAFTGKVVFKEGATTLGTINVTNGKAPLLLANLTLGSHAITATYQGDANYAGASAGLTQTVTASTVATTTTIQVAASSIAGETVTLTAFVVPAAGTAKPNGSVTFRDGNTVIGSTLLDPTGKALWLANSLSIGSHTITATYNGAGIFTGSASTPAMVTVRLASKSSIAASASTSVFSQAVTLTASIAPAVAGAVQPAGTVTFFDGATSLGTKSIVNGVAILTTGPLNVAIHKFTAVYNGNMLFATSRSGGAYVNVRAASTSVALQPPSAPGANGKVTLTASIGPVAPAAGMPAGKVTFMDGSTALGSAMLANGQAKLQIPKLTAGNHYLRAIYEGAGGFAGSSSAIVSVSGTGTAPSTTATVTALEASVAFVGQTTNLKATVSTIVPGTTKASGRVTFKDGATVLGSVMLQNGIATFSIKLAAGPHILIAVYEGTTVYATSASTPLAYVVKTSNSPR